MSIRTISVILHGHEWPDPTWTQELRAALAAPPGAGPAGVIEVVEARESRGRARGAASIINAAIEGAKGDLLLVVEAGCAWDRRLVADLGATVWHADVLAVAAPGYVARPAAPDERTPGTWNDAWIPTAIPEGIDFVTLLQQATEVPLHQWTAKVHGARPRLWAIRRATFQALGALDAAFWSVGVVEDLADRARARNVGLRIKSGPAASTSLHDAWPLQPHLRQFLAVRNVLLSAARTQPAAQAGRAFGLIAALSFADAWRRADIDPEQFRFGGTWGRPRGPFTRPGRRNAAEERWPARPAGTILPILAMDAFLDEVIARAADPALRRAAPPDPPSRHTAAGAAATTGVLARTTARPTAGERDDVQVRDRAEPAVDRPGPGSWPAGEAPLASVIVVNWNGREHLEPCFSSLLESDYPRDRLEFICVDNGSTDGSREWLASRFPQVRLVALDTNRGFTGGNVAGVSEARGDVLVFFNNDMRVEPHTVRALVSALDGDVACAAAQVLSWNGRHVDFVRGSANFEAHGFQDHYGEVWRPERAVAGDTFFPNGGAFAITRQAYEAAGGFDDLFFAYYDDVDLGYGVRLNGGGICVAGDARVYHRHGATSRRYPQGQKRFLMERNAVWTVLKRYDDESLERAFGAILLLAARRIAQETVLSRRAPWVRSLAPFSTRCRPRPAATAAPRTAASDQFQPPPGGSQEMLREDLEAPVLAAVPVESLAAIGEALRGMPDMIGRRRISQARRRVADRVVFRDLGRPLAYGSPLTSYQAAHDVLVETLQLAEIFRSRPRLLIVTHEPLRKRMSGPGVRVLELGRAVGRSVSVTIATPTEPEIADDRCRIVAYAPDRPGSLRLLAEEADVLLVQGFALTQFPFLTSMHVPIVVDLYCPFTIEFLEMKTAEAHARGAAAPDLDVQLEALGVLEVQNAQLRHGDFFVCASERQRDFWIGALHGANRVNAQTYATDPSLRSLVDVVPFGVPQEDFVDAVASARAMTGERVLKGVRPRIGPADKVLFWGGSLLDWQDPLTLIRAVARLARTRPEIKLFFAGTKHPNPQVAPMRIVERSMNLARDLGVLDSAVFFNDWIPYDERAAYLREADLGLSTHRLHLETHLSFRTRMLDYIWAALPIVCTEGDYFADLVRSRGLGLVVPAEDDGALAAAIVRLLDDHRLRDDTRSALREVREELRWARIAEPLRRFVAAPRFAADHEPAIRAIRARLRQSYRASRWLKRTALRLGVSEGRVEQLKGLAPVRMAVRMRNRLALARAGRMRG